LQVAVVHDLFLLPIHKDLSWRCDPNDHSAKNAKDG
jgi:hypothetical protein